MKPAPFEYEAPHTVDETLALLAEAPGDTSLLAGGQSLVPLLNLRLARPALIVDLNGVAELAGIGASNGSVRIGAMTRQRAAETNTAVCERLPLLAEALQHVAHVPIRTRGTVGGSLVHADPAAELPAVALALEARLALRGVSGERTVAADEFFLGPFTTAREADELLVAVDFPVPPPGTGWAFNELTRVHGAFALVGVAALLHANSNGRIDLARVVVFGVGAVPYAPSWLADVALGEVPGEALFARVVERMRESIDPPDDTHGSSQYRREIAGVFTARALATAARRASLEVGP